MNREVKEVLFMTAFPNRDKETSTVLVYAKTVEERYILIWSPKARKLDCEMNVEADDWSYKRVLKINGTVYGAEDDYLFKVIDLNYKKEISKSDIEKMFGCEVVDK